MITFLCVKQIGYELLVKKRNKQMEIFLLKKNDNTILQLSVSG